jgi:hypothetical protein
MNKILKLCFESFVDEQIKVIKEICKQKNLELENYIDYIL